MTPINGYRTPEPEPGTMPCGLTLLVGLLLLAALWGAAIYLIAQIVRVTV